jgi:hypothetical protein
MKIKRSVKHNFLKNLAKEVNNESNIVEMQDKQPFSHNAI